MTERERERAPKDDREKEITEKKTNELNSFHFFVFFFVFIAFGLAVCFYRILAFVFVIPIECAI